MSVIWKYPLDEKISRLEIPRDARLLTVQSQRGTPTLWARVNPDAPTERRIIAGIGTGEDIIESPGNPLTYISTVQTAGGFVWHFFEAGA